MNYNYNTTEVIEVGDSNDSVPLTFIVKNGAKRRDIQTLRLVADKPINVYGKEFDKTELINLIDSVRINNTK